MNALPTKLKILKGTREKSREPENEMEFEGIKKIPPPPKYFDDIAKKEWKRTTEILNNIGMLHDTDIPQLQIYCYLVSIIEKAAETLSKENIVVVETNAKGMRYMTKNKWISVYNEAVDRLVKLGHEFGFSPSSRTRISIPKKSGSGDKFFND